MLSQFSRTELLIGDEAMKKLANSRVAVFGLGGVGGYTVEALVRSGIGAIDLIDNDRICHSNLNRQIFATNSTIGLFKVDVAYDRIKDINSNINVVKHNVFYTPSTCHEFDFLNYDYVVDAIDTVVGKISLIEECKKLNIPIISAMGAGNKLNPTLFEVADISKTSVCPLARVIRQELKKRKIFNVKVVYSKEPPVKTDCVNISIPLDNVSEDVCNIKSKILASNAFCPSVMGLIIASEVIKDLIKL